MELPGDLRSGAPRMWVGKMAGGEGSSRRKWHETRLRKWAEANS